MSCLVKHVDHCLQHQEQRPGFFLGQIDGIVRRIAAELGTEPKVIATGGLAPLVLEECRTVTDHEPDLTLIGLRLVYERNREISTRP